ncbi:alpha-D-ribose 1-methylphosphonate 5-triphosphate diphosphatase [Nesterenkonia muleiensis]|uniref:alpha-D-ribose 1-methylphosphonate 5-triphosphate diphosphatase n=1 Tax=Nesterenkonia muleiensis TaxID=2282648 RepID=UPI000E754555|nr:alpha-D-ribose 1-methylphosphonate 5-triphosphate diphosphatase [Nesterenkonia muleiensis]
MTVPVTEAQSPGRPQVSEQLVGWPLGAPPADYAIRGVRAVMPDRILDNATVVVREGRIAGVVESLVDTAADLDGCDLLLTPGFIDVHSDALEKERSPRANAEVPVEFAIASYEGRIASAGITTMFHGAAFQHQTARGIMRSTGRAVQTCHTVDATDSYRVDHRVLHRLDVFSEQGAQALSRRLEQLGADATVQLVSYEDHTPGQGQYADPEVMRRALIDGDGLTHKEATVQVERLIAERAEKWGVREANMSWLASEASAGRIRLLGHDPDSAEEILALQGRGGTVAEFPTTLEAASSAREAGMTIVAGAPNVLRGGSHSGNISARELAREGLVDALASDYLPSSLLAASVLLAQLGIIPLPEAIGLVSSGPARVAGLADRGALNEGMRADFALIDDRIGAWPRVAATFLAS